MNGRYQADTHFFIHVLIFHDAMISGKVHPRSVIENRNLYLCLYLTLQVLQNIARGAAMIIFTPPFGIGNCILLSFVGISMTPSP
jgi:hypothetical protein